MEADGNGGVSPSGFICGGHGVARLVLSEREITFSLTTLKCQRFIAPSASIRSRGSPHGVDTAYGWLAFIVSLLISTALVCSFLRI